MANKIPRVSKILDTASRTMGRKKKIAYLQSHRPNQVMLKIFRHTFDPALQLDLPPGTPPYSPTDPDLYENGLYQNARKLDLFVKNRPQPIAQLRKETLFVQLLESVHPDDALLILGVKEGKLPYKGLTESLIREAFPNLLPNQEEK